MPFFILNERFCMFPFHLRLIFHYVILMPLFCNLVCYLRPYSLPPIWRFSFSSILIHAYFCSVQVRRKLVEEWLPVLVVCKDNVSPVSPSNKSLYLELEETFLRIISTLPMSDAQELLQRCLSFSTRNVEDCPHLVSAFNTWFRRAAQPLKPDCLFDQWDICSVLLHLCWLASQILCICLYTNSVQKAVV